MTYGITLIIIALALTMIPICFYGSSRAHQTGGEAKGYAFNGFAAVCLIGAFVIGICTLNSYRSYMDIKAFYNGGYQQYADTVNEYNRIISTNRGSGQEITDLKFQGFQKSMADLIREQRQQVVNYNRIVVEKRILAQNPLVGCFVFVPDSDMEILPLIPTK